MTEYGDRKANVKRKPLTAERVRELLCYDPDTGVLTWRVTRGASAAAGDAAGWVHHSGYIHICIDRAGYLAHRIAWLYTYGVWPKNYLDHINTIRSDNRLLNLREATHRENMGNSRLRKNNTSGLKGVSLCKKSGLWIAQIGIDDTRKHLGRFTSREIAHSVYCEAARSYFGDFARQA